MRTFFSISRLLLIAVTVFALSSCASNNVPAPLDSGSNCHNWCHNGWCSTHCDDAS